MTLEFAPTTEASHHAKFQALLDHILIKPDKGQKPAAIWLPDQPHTRYRVGRIVSMGQGMKVNGRGKVRYGRNIYTWKGGVDELGYNRYPMPRAKVGDRVLYVTWSVNIIVINKLEHHLIRDTAIELVFDEKKEGANGGVLEAAP